MNAIENKVTTALFRVMKSKGICPFSTDYSVLVRRDNKILVTIDEMETMYLGGIGMDMKTIYTRLERFLDWYLSDLQQSNLLEA